MHALREQPDHALRQRPVLNQLLYGEIGLEAPDREHRAVERERGDDRVDARSVRQTGVDHRRRLVHPPADLAHDPIDHGQQVRIVAERRRHANELAVALDVDLMRAVYQDVADRRIAEQWLDRPESDDLVHDLLDHFLALVLAQRRLLGAQELDDGGANLPRELALVLDLLERLEVESLDQSPVEIDLELLDGAERRLLALPSAGVHPRRALLGPGRWRVIAERHRFGGHRPRRRGRGGWTAPPVLLDTGETFAERHSLGPLLHAKERAQRANASAM